MIENPQVEINNNRLIGVAEIILYAQLLDIELKEVYYHFKRTYPKNRLTLGSIITRIFQFQRNFKDKIFEKKLQSKLFKFVKIRNFYAHAYFINGIVINHNTGEVLDHDNLIEEDLNFIKATYNEIFSILHARKFKMLPSKIENSQNVNIA